MKIDELSPELLWRILATKPKLAGPWAEANDPVLRVSVHQGWWRRAPDNKAVVTVYPSTKLVEPNYGDYDNEFHGDYPDFDGYDRAVAHYAAEQKRWKPWSYYCSLSSSGYAETLEEARRIADVTLRAQGWILLDRLPEEEP